VRVGGRGRLGVGERAADFVLSGRSGAPARFYAHAGGRPTAVVFDGDGDDPRLVDLTGRLAARDDVALCCVTSKGPAGGTGIPTWSDRDGAVAEAYGVAAGELTAVVLDPNLRVVGVVVGDSLAGRVVELLDAAVHRDRAVQVVAQAPVLLLPRVLDAAYQDRLIRVWERGGGTDTGVARAGGLRVLARRTDQREAPPADPLEPALRALRAYAPDHDAHEARRRERR